MSPVVAVPESLQKLSDSEREALAKQISALMPVVAERIHYAEGRRSNYSVIAGVLLAAGLALLAFAAPFAGSEILRIPALTAGALLSFLGLFILHLYALQTNRYPWTSATNTWKWFYRDALPDQAAFDLPWNGYWRWGREGSRVKAAFNSQLAAFGARLTELKDPTLSLWQDVQQLYVLHVNEKYKNLFLTHLRKALNVGLVLTFSSVIVAAALVWTAKHCGMVENKYHSDSSQAAIEVTWRPLASSPSTLEKAWIINVAVTNLGASDLKKIVLRALDNKALRVPCRIQSGSDLMDAVVAVGGSETLALIVTTPADPSLDSIKFEAHVE